MRRHTAGLPGAGALYMDSRIMVPYRDEIKEETKNTK